MVEKDFSEIIVDIKKKTAFVQNDNKTYCIPLEYNNRNIIIQTNFLSRFQEMLKLDYSEEEIPLFIQKINLKISKYNASLNLLYKMLEPCKLDELEYDYDDVYILRANSGEISVIFAYLIKTLLQKNNSKKPLFIATQKYLVDIVKLYIPNANIIYIDIYMKLTTVAFDDLNYSWNCDGHNYYYLFPNNHFDEINENMGKIHFIDQIYKTIGLNINDTTKPEFQIDLATVQQVQKKLEDIHLNLNKFVIIAPEAKTYCTINNKFWEHLIKQLQAEDYDIFLNTKDKKLSRLRQNSIKIAPLTLTELFYLATLSKGIITLRSGIADFLIPTQTPMVVLCSYIAWSNTTRENELNAYSILKTPFIDQNLVKEINVTEYGEKGIILINDIIKILKGSSF